MFTMGWNSHQKPPRVPMGQVTKSPLLPSLDDRPEVEGNQDTEQPENYFTYYYNSRIWLLLCFSHLFAKPSYLLIRFI